MIEVSQDRVLEMAKVGVLFGHKRSKTHPRMKQHVAHNRNEIEVLSPESVEERLKTASDFLKNLIQSNGVLLCVATTAPARDVVSRFAEKRAFPFVGLRWLGGTLTNFDKIKERINYFLDLQGKRERGELSKYTKKEQLEFSKLIGKMSQSFSSLTSLRAVPSALFVVDPAAHQTAIKEARKLSIPIVAILDTNDDERLVDYPIFGNDHNTMSIEWLISEIEKAL